LCILATDLLGHEVLGDGFRVSRNFRLLGGTLVSITGPTVGNGGLTESHADRMQLLEIAVRKIRVTFGQVINSLFHPVALIFFAGLEDATPIDVTEELVASSVQDGLLCDGGLHL
jgi:hypothetical protein